MNRYTGRPDGSDETGSYIWLRYATQFRVGDRTHTIEMGIPVPIGASEEQREHLMREAEVGMEQLANRVERRIARVTSSSSSSSQASQPSQPSSSIPAAQSTQRNQAAQTVTPSPKQVEPLTLAKASATSPVSAATQDNEVIPSPTFPIRESGQPASNSKDVSVPVPPTRHSIGASMPSSTSSDAGGGMKLPQFIQYIKDSLGLTPKQAMELLNVKTLSCLNLRDALERLQALVARDSVASTPTVLTPAVREAKATRPEGKATSQTTQANQSSSQATTSSTTPTSPTQSSNTKIQGIKEITHAVVREAPSPQPYGFDEEVDMDGGEEGEEGEEEGIDLGTDEGIEYMPELTDQEREIAEDIFTRLKEARGSTAASDARLRVLRNVVGDQASDEQLLQITSAAWGVNALKKLKSDQVEALISWAKEDDFMNETEMVLMLIQEGQYAGSDR